MTTKPENQAAQPAGQGPADKRLLAATKSYEKAIRLVQSGDPGDPNIFLEEHLDRISDGMGSLLVYLDQVSTDLVEVRRRTLSLIDQIQDRSWSSRPFLRGHGFIIATAPAPTHYAFRALGPQGTM
jgi:hypothetical protein